ncbi:MAG: nucleotidyltransferase family protein [Fimbriimonadales bacterium]|nr:nucleotidyltransferase family protein [Fimbriimonadales bacterium]
MIVPMRSLQDIQAILRQHMDELRERYGVKSLRIFGSYARGEQTPESDVDILVELEKPIGLRYFELWDYLEALLGVRVDLLTPNALRRKPRLQQQVQQELIHV